jgi:hypothetical protein
LREANENREKSRLTYYPRRRNDERRKRRRGCKATRLQLSGQSGDIEKEKAASARKNVCRTNGMPVKMTESGPSGGGGGVGGPSGPPGARAPGTAMESTYLMEHLATFTVTKETGIVYPADGMRRLLQLEKSNGIWSQKMQLRLERNWVLIMDNETGVRIHCSRSSLYLSSPLMDGQDMGIRGPSSRRIPQSRCPDRDSPITLLREC